LLTTLEPFKNIFTSDISLLKSGLVKPAKS